MDLIITAVVTAATVVPLLLPSPGDWWLILLALLASVPLYWRRAAPMWTGLVVALAMCVLVLWVKPLLPYGPLVSVYTVASLDDKMKRLVSIPVIAVTATLSLALPNEQPETWRYMATVLVAAYALGVGARARRAHASELAERTRRLAHERGVAAAHERTRIARDVHDIVTHSVGLMVVQAEAGPVVLRSDPARAEGAFNAIGDIGRGALVQLRGLLTTLRATDGSPGVDALGQLVERISDAGLHVRLEHTGTPRPVPSETGVTIYRVTQEALTNVLRHSPADAVTVHLSWQPTTLTLQITETATTPAPASTPVPGRAGPGIPHRTGGHGLAGMRERVAACGGTFEAGPGAHGFVVTAHLPVG